jgi:hypothetical protein
MSKLNLQAKLTKSKGVFAEIEYLHRRKLYLGDSNNSFRIVCRNTLVAACCGLSLSVINASLVNNGRFDLGSPR